MLACVYLQHGAQSGLALLDAMQRMTTCASLRHYNVSVGLDDCLLSREVTTVAHTIIDRSVRTMLDNWAVVSSHEQQRYAYTVHEEDQIITQLIGTQCHSESYVLESVMGKQFLPETDQSTSSTSVASTDPTDAIRHCRQTTKSLCYVC